MKRIRISFAVAILIPICMLLWVSTATINASVPIWIVIDALVVQIVLLAGISAALQRP